MSKEKEAEKTAPQKDIQPYSDFEITLATTQFQGIKKVSKGRYLLWGVVETSDAPF